MIGTTTFGLSGIAVQANMTVTNEALVPAGIQRVRRKGGRSDVAQLPEPVPLQHQCVEQNAQLYKKWFGTESRAFR